MSDEERLRRMGLTPNLDKVFETPEPQGPTTAFERFIRDWGPGDDMEGAAYAEFRDELRAVQAEARTAAPPDIDALLEALVTWLFPRGLDHPGSWSLTNEGARAIARAARRLASPDATEKKPFEYENLGYSKGPGR